MHTTKPRNKFQCNIFLVYQAEGETKGSHLFQLFFKKDIAIALSCPSLHVELLEYNLRDNLHCVFCVPGSEMRHHVQKFSFVWY